RRLAVATGLLLLAASAVGLLVPPLLGHLVDLVVANRSAGALWPTVAALAGVAVVQAVLVGVGGQATARVGETVLAALRERVLDRALAVPAARLERAGTGDLVSRVSGDVAVVSQAIASVVPQMVQAGLTVALTLVGLLAIDPRLAAAALAAVPLQAIGLRWYLRTVVPVYRRERLAEGERSQALASALA
ncbi:ABC transporter transmembrane domain-containing protein, partial [Patulibacter sp. S7RM1-6]